MPGGFNIQSFQLANLLKFPYWKSISAPKRQDMKKNEFKINFDVPIRGSDILVPMTAIAELHHSDVYYLLRSIEIVPRKDGQTKGDVFIQELKIKQLKGEKESIWVHCDTMRESELSRSAGLAIEASPDFIAE